MRKCLVAIRDLDPAGVDARLSEMDAEIVRLERLLGSKADAGVSDRAPQRTAAVRAA